MKYSDIIGVKKDYQSVFDMTDERTGYWKNFVTNLAFEKNLREIINSFESGKPKSVWVQGTYGTGKSHSSSVIKHLLSDPVNEIEDFLNTLSDSQLRYQVKSFRQKHTIFPVVLKGICGIRDSNDMGIAIQNAIKEECSHRGIQLGVQTDFERMIEFVNTPKFSSFVDYLVSDVFSSYGLTKEGIINKLQEKDLDTLDIIEKQLKDGNLSSVTNAKGIEVWLRQVADFLISNHYCTDLMIFWDEFTPLLSITERRAILSTTQNIAELSGSSHVFLFVITHISYEASDAYKEISAKERDLVKDRFLVQPYDAQYDTVYQILFSTFDRKNTEVLEKLIGERVEQNYEVTECIENISSNSLNSAEAKNKLIHLYPLHPYTSFSATFLARNVGSSQRSIFNFLTDKTTGFNSFLNQDIQERKFVTLDYIWDFFLPKLDEDPLYRDIINCYKENRASLEKGPQNVLRVLKGVLLLNVLQSNVSVSEDSSEDQQMIAPYQNNIISAYSGEFSAQEVINCLTELDKNGIISKTPKNKYEISLNRLSDDVIQTAKKEIISTIRNVEDLKVRFGEAFDSLTNVLETKLSRRLKVFIYSPSKKQSDIEEDINAKLSVDIEGSIILPLFINFGFGFEGESHLNIDDVRTLCQKLSSKFSNKPVVIASINGTELDRKAYDNIVNDLAEEKAFKDQGDYSTSIKKNSDASEWVKQFIAKINDENECSIYYSDSVIPTSFNQIPTIIQKKIIPVLFSKGLDSYHSLPKTAWKSQKKPSDKIIEAFLIKSEKDLEKKSQTSKLTPLFRDNTGIELFNDNLELVNFNAVTPESQLIQKVKETFETHQKDSIIDIADNFGWIFEPPYGYGMNEVSFAAVALAFRPYIGKIYEATNGQIISELGMKALIIDLFNYRFLSKSLTDKLRVRFTTESARNFMNSLQRIFDLEKGADDGISNVKWAMRTKFKAENKAPLWMLKYYPKADKNNSALYDGLFELSVQQTENISDERISQLNEMLSDHSDELVLKLKELKKDDLVQNYIKDRLSDGHDDLSVSDCYDFVKASMSLEVVYWTETDLNRYIDAFIENCTAKKTDVSSDVRTVGNGNQANSPICPTENGEKSDIDVSPIRNALNHKSLNNDQLREVVLKIGEKHQDLIEELAQMIENYHE